MTRARAKILIVELIERGMVPVITRVNADEYTMTVEVTQGNLTPAQLQSVIDMQVGVQIRKLEFT